MAGTPIKQKLSPDMQEIADILNSRNAEMAAAATPKASVDEALNIVRGGGKRGPKLREEQPEKKPENFLKGHPVMEEFQGYAKSTKSPKDFNDLRQSYIDKFNNDMMINLPGKGPVNLAPNSGNVWFRMPDGTIDKRPRGRPIPRGATVLNKKPEEIEALFPPAREMPKGASAEDAAIAAAREANEAARASRASESATAAETAAALESRASAMNPPAPPPRPAPGPDVTAASPAEQVYRAGQPTREAVQSNAPRNVAVGVGLGALGAGAARQAYNEMPYRSSGADVGEFNRMDYVPPRSANTDVSDFSRMDYVEPSSPLPSRVPDVLAPVGPDWSPTLTDVSKFSQMDYVSPQARNAILSARRSAAPATATQIATAAADNPTGGGFFNRLANAIYDPNYQKGMSSKQMFEQMQRDPRGELSFAQEESPAAYARAAQRAREEGEGRASGGKAGNGVPKDAALHKALEIIHRLISR